LLRADFLFPRAMTIKGVSKLRVLLVDDHPIVRQGLRQLINHEPDLEVCAEAEDSSSALDLLASRQFDFIIVDISLKTVDGLTLIRQIKSLYPRVPILVVSMHDESLYAERALRAGALGYIMKQEGTEKMIHAIRKVLEGKIYLSDEMDARFVQQAVTGRNGGTLSPIERLSDRELEVFRLIGKGFTSRHIAESLFVSVKTVDSYRTNIKDKLSLRNAMELIQHAMQWVQNEKTVAS